jgi:hypothetical protein
VLEVVSEGDRHWASVGSPASSVRRWMPQLSTSLEPLKAGRRQDRLDAGRHPAVRLTAAPLVSSA